jgi:ABC-2 type transport system ATP-binding protein
MEVITATSLRAGYRGHPVLHGVNLDFGQGLHLVLGPNGAGKTTLFRTLAGVLPPQAGQVRINGRDPFSEPAAKRDVGVSTHRTALAPRLSVADNLQYHARILGIPAQSRDRAVERVLDLLDLNPIAGQMASKLSRGQAQRAALARALLADPPVLILDEPFAGIDAVAAVRLRGQLRDFASSGRTLLISTHDLAEASEIADDVVVIRDGAIIGQGPAGQLRRDIIGTGYRLRIKGTGDLAGALKQLGLARETLRDGSAVVAVADEDAAREVIARLIGAGIGLSEAGPAANPLEDLYLHLQQTARGDQK